MSRPVLWPTLTGGRLDGKPVPRNPDRPTLLRLPIGEPDDYGIDAPASVDLVEYALRPVGFGVGDRGIRVSVYADTALPDDAVAWRLLNAALVDAPAALERAAIVADRLLELARRNDRLEEPPYQRAARLAELARYLTDGDR